ncbi:MAG: serine phosphatase RsbU (regulator of sigma subunit), partial [Flavobacteriales bacterium]
FSIGSFEYGEKEYKNQVLKLERDDMIYIFSDGYVDQFGGPKGKKFMKKKLRELLLQIAHLEVEIQHQKLNEALITWKRSLDQVDDILMIGVRV